MRTFVLVAAAALALGVNTVSATAGTATSANTAQPSMYKEQTKIINTAPKGIDSKAEVKGGKIAESKRSNTIHHPDGRVSDCLSWDHGKCAKMTKPEWPEKTGKPDHVVKPGKPRTMIKPYTPGVKPQIVKPRPSPLKDSGKTGSK